MHLIRNRLPQRKDTLQVAAAIVFIVFSWSLYHFFYHFPSFILGYDPGEMLGIFSYMMSFALLESVLVIVMLVSLCLVLPQKWFKVGFAYKGTLIVLISALAVARLRNFEILRMPEHTLLYRDFAITLAVIIVSVVAFHFLLPLQKFLLEILDRLGIFLYIYVPMGILAFMIVIFRNLW